MDTLQASDRAVDCDLADADRSHARDELGDVFRAQLGKGKAFVEMPDDVQERTIAVNRRF